jgi:hypothetical protein
MMIRSFLLSAFFYLNFLSVTVSQELKFGTTTLKKTYQGAAPIVSVKYELNFKKKKKQEWSIDSVKSVADGKLLPFYLLGTTDNRTYKKLESKKLTRNENGFFRLDFNITTILSEERLPYSEDDRPVQYNMTKGVCIYYRVNGKTSTTLITTFKELPQVVLP